MSDHDSAVAAVRSCVPTPPWTTTRRTWAPARADIASPKSVNAPKNPGCTVDPDFASTAIGRPASTTRSTSAPLRSRKKARSAGRPLCARHFSTSETTQDSKIAPRKGWLSRSVGLRIPSR